MYKKIPNFILYGATAVLGLIVLALCIFALPSMWRNGPLEFPEARTAVRLIVIGLYATTIPFFIGLWHVFRLLRYVGKDMGFSDLAIKALHNIKYCALIIGVMCMIGVPLLLPIAEADDAPGLLVVGFAIACAPFVIASFIEILQRLLRIGMEKSGIK